MKNQRGGKKKAWKLKGRQSPRKQYQNYSRAQVASGLVPDGRGGWMPSNQIRDRVVQSGWDARRARSS